MTKSKQLLAMLLLAWGFAGEVQALAVEWVDWTSVNAGAPLTETGTAAGVAVTVSGGPQLAPQLDPALNYWANNPATYTGAGVPAGPQTSDLIRVTGPGTFTMTFSVPVTNPVMAILSLGSPPTQWDFGNQSMTILKNGPGYFGNGSFTQTGNILTGNEAHGLIQLNGTITSVTFIMPTFENWTGFTVGFDAPGSLPPPVPPDPITSPSSQALTIELAWEYADPPVDTTTDPPTVANAVGFAAYREIGAPCDDPAPLATVLVSLSNNPPVIPATERTYLDPTVPDVTGPVCYELTAYNDVGESIRSNRAVMLGETIAPARPQGVTIEVCPNC